MVCLTVSGQVKDWIILLDPPAAAGLDWDSDFGIPYSIDRGGEDDFEGSMDRTVGDGLGAP